MCIRDSLIIVIFRNRMLVLAELRYRLLAADLHAVAVEAVGAEALGLLPFAISQLILLKMLQPSSGCHVWLIARGWSVDGAFVGEVLVGLVARPAIVILGLLALKRFGKVCATGLVVLAVFAVAFAAPAG